MKRDAPDAELPRHLGWNDGLRANTRECAFDTMEGQRRVAHATHQYIHFVIRQGDGSASSVLNILDRIIETGVNCFLFLRGRWNHVVYAGDEDLPGGADKLPHKVDEVGHGLVDGPAEDA